MSRGLPRTLAGDIRQDRERRIDLLSGREPDALAQDLVRAEERCAQLSGELCRERENIMEWERVLADRNTRLELQRALFKQERDNKALREALRQMVGRAIPVKSDAVLELARAALARAGGSK